MKIGILTLFCEYNYGSVLQALALMHYLRDCGHTVVFVDRQITPGNVRLKWMLASRSLRDWLIFFIKGALGLGVFKKLFRHIKSIRLVKKHFPITSYSFYNWKDAPSDLGVNLIVVGSDQVWSPLDPSPYLLIGAPKCCPAIAYGASIGAYSLEDKWRRIYEEGLRNFMYISVREWNGVKLLQDFGINPAHVVDPTLLVDGSFWRRYIQSKHPDGRKKFVAYFFDVNVLEEWRDIALFVRDADCDAEIFVDVLPSPNLFSVKSLLNYYYFRLACFSRRIHLRTSADSFEFLTEVSHADFVATDSYHGFMFSVVFRRNVRIVRPKSEARKAMFSRLDEMVPKCCKGTVFANDLHSSLRSLLTDAATQFNDDYIEARRAYSRNWLNNVLEKIGGNTI